MKISKKELMESNEKLVKENTVYQNRIKDLERINEMYHKQIQDLRKLLEVE